jgi:hypothetical protein
MGTPYHTFLDIRGVNSLLQLGFHIVGVLIAGHLPVILAPCMTSTTDRPTSRVCVCSVMHMLNDAHTQWIVAHSGIMWLCICIIVICKTSVWSLEVLTFRASFWQQKASHNISEHLIIAGSLCDLHHPANLSTVKRQWQHTTPISFYRGYTPTSTLNCGELWLFRPSSGGGIRSACVRSLGGGCSAHMRLCSTLGGPDPFLTFMRGVCILWILLFALSSSCVQASEVNCMPLLLNEMCGPSK